MIVPKTNIKDRMYRNILESIIRGEYQAEMILTEKMLVDRYEVSKSPIREALIELCNEGILRSIPRFGYEIIRITDRDIQDVQNFRLLIECGSMEKHWHLLRPERIQAIIDDNSGCEECDAFEHWEHNSNFHLELIACFGNKFVYNSLSDALRFLSRAYAQFYWDQWHRTKFVSKEEHHRKILLYIQEGNKEKALKALEEDINEFARGDEFYKPIFLEPQR